MFAFPMLIVWIILAGVLICMLAAIVVMRVRGESIGVNPFTILAITIFVTSALGYFVTNYASPTPETWSHALLARVLWQFGGGVLLALAVLIEGRASVVTWILGLVFLGLGFLMSYNALLDLVHGPLLLRGQVDLTVEKTRHIARLDESIRAYLVLTAADGTRHTINMAGWGATEAIDKLQECERWNVKPGDLSQVGEHRVTGGDARDPDVANVELLVLPRLQRVIEARCAPSDSDH